MTADRHYNRRHMPETAQLIAEARQRLAEFGPLKLIYAHENGCEVGTADEVVDQGHIDLGGVKIAIIKTKPRLIGSRATPVLDTATKTGHKFP